jgi:hypothetical protein
MQEGAMTDQELDDLEEIQTALAAGTKHVHSGNVVHVEWKLPVEAPQHTKTILIVHWGTVYSGVFSLPKPPHQDAKVILFPEDLSPVRLADCDYWADLPERPYQ